MGPEARQNAAPASSIRAPSSDADFPWLLADAAARNRRTLAAGVRLTAPPPHSSYSEEQAPAAKTLQEAEIEPLYKILLNSRKIRPSAHPEPVHLTRHPKYCA